MESILKQAPEKRLIGGERDHAVADIPWRQDAIFAAQAAGTAAVIGHRNHGGEISDRRFDFAVGVSRYFLSKRNRNVLL
jgi:hypothetical protein